MKLKNATSYLKKNTIFIKSPYQMLGYFPLVKKNILYKKIFWPTEDYVELKDSNFLKILGRKNLYLNCGGEKFLFSDIENLLMKIENILFIQAFSISNSILGEVLGLKILYKEINLKNETINLIKKVSFEQLPRYAQPFYFYELETFPINTRLKKSA